MENRFGMEDYNEENNRPMTEPQPEPDSTPQPEQDSTPEMNAAETGTPEMNATEPTAPEWNAAEPAAPEWNATETAEPEMGSPEPAAEEHKEPVEDFYADGMNVKSAGKDRAGSPEHTYREYRFGPEWQKKQTAPQPYQKNPKSNRNGIIAACAVALAVGLLGGAVFAGIRSLGSWALGPQQFAEPSEELDLPEEPEVKQASPTLIPAVPDTTEGNITSSADGQLSVADVAEMTMPAMVSISTMSVQQVYSFFGQVENREVPGAASGIIVGETEKELLIATNDHVIAGARQLSVCFVDEEVVEAVVKGTDAENDLAIVAVQLEDIKDETKEAIRVIRIGDSDQVRIGEEVVAIGNALGFGQSVSSGVISALNRTVVVDDGSEHVLMQTDAAINPGNSGGALLNRKGELIGINEVKYVAEDTEGIGYAIPITVAKPILDELMNRETRTKVKEGESGYLGITCITVTEESSKSYRIPMGVFVDTVTEGSAAEKAGILPRDIITKIEDYSVSTSNELVEELSYYAAGETVTLTISRLGINGEYEETEIEVTLDRRPADLDTVQNPDMPESSGNGR